MTNLPAEWRRGLFRLANALIVYGVIGVLVAAIGIAALVASSGQIGSLGERIVSEAVSLDAIVVLTADVLDDAATTVGTLGPTVERTSVTVGSAAGALRDIEPRLRDVETQANAFEIFGQRPVASLGQLFGQIATDISGLPDQLDGIATELARNQTALTANAASLRTLANVVRAYKDRVKPEAIDAGLDESRRLMLFTLALFIGWTAVPAVGSLIVGCWIRRLVDPERVPPSDSPGSAPRIDSARS